MKYEVYAHKYEDMRGPSGLVTVEKEQSTGRKLFASCHVEELVTVLAKTKGWHIRNNSWSPALVQKLFEATNLYDAMKLARVSAWQFENKKGVWDDEQDS